MYCTKKVLILLVFILLNISFASHASKERDKFTKKQLIEVFNVATFGFDKDRELSRWEVDNRIGIWLVGDDIGDKQREKINQALAQASEVSGASFSFKDKRKGEDYNVFFNITSTPTYDALIRYRKVYEFFYEEGDAFMKRVWGWEKDDIEFYGQTLLHQTSNRKVAVLVNIRNGENNFNAGLGWGVMFIHGLTYAAGENEWLDTTTLTSMSARYRQHIYENGLNFNGLTEFDELLLKILYDSRLKIGMKYSEAQPIIQNIVDGLID